MHQIRPILPHDINAIKEVLDSIELFPADMLDDMIYDFFNNEESSDIWLTALDNKQPIALAYCAPERMTEGTYNLYAIGIHKNYQGKGVGSQIMEYIEVILKEAGHRVLIVETSGLESYALARQFYQKCNYHQEATIRDFYQEGEDKVVFWKKLA